MDNEEVQEEKAPSIFSRRYWSLMFSAWDVRKYGPRDYGVWAMSGVQTGFTTHLLYWVPKSWPLIVAFVKTSWLKAGAFLGAVGKAVLVSGS